MEIKIAFCEDCTDSYCRSKGTYDCVLYCKKGRIEPFYFLDPWDKCIAPESCQIDKMKELGFRGYQMVKSVDGIKDILSETDETLKHMISLLKRKEELELQLVDSLKKVRYFIKDSSSWSGKIILYAERNMTEDEEKAANQRLNGVGIEIINLK